MQVCGPLALRTSCSVGRACVTLTTTDIASFDTFAPSVATMQCLYAITLLQDTTVAWILQAQSLLTGRVPGAAANRSEEARKEAGRKAARTRAERYGEELKVSAEENDDLKGVDTTK